MTTYYLSTKSGNDSNNGTSAGQAWSSFAKLSGKVKPGDTILLEKGSDFNEALSFSKVNGTAEHPITISSYGVGDNPILSSDTGRGISAVNSSHFIVENLTIKDTGTVAFYGSNANNWIVRNVTVDNAGGKTNLGSINWSKSSNILFENNTFTHSKGDGVYMTGVTNVAIKDNEFLGVTGSNADNIQIEGTNTLISGNIMVVDPGSDTTKGNVVFHGEGLYLHDNYMQGGSFGLSVSANNVVVENNVIKDHTKYSWSSNVLISDQVTGDIANNITISDNNLYNANRDISIDGKNTTSAVMTINNIEITGNEFHDWTKAPLALNGVNLNGVFADNTSDKEGSFVYAVTSNTGQLITSDNIYVPEIATIKQALAPATKTITITASSTLFEGGAPLLKLLLNGVQVGEQAVTASKTLGNKQVLTFELSSFHEGDTFAIKYANDKFNVRTGEDRNLYVHSISIDGQSLRLKEADISGKIFHQKDGSGMFFSSNATANFTSDDVPASVFAKDHMQPATPIRLEDILESEDHHIFYGGENHTVGSTAVSDFGAGFKDLSSGLDDLHQALSDNFA